MSDIFPIDRPPRIQPELPIDLVKIPAPPAKEESRVSQLVQIALPLLSIVGYGVVSLMGGIGRSPLMLLPMALSVVAATCFSFYTHRKEKQRLAALEDSYSERLTELHKEMQHAHNQQRRFYNYNYPDCVTLFRLLRTVQETMEREERPLRVEVRVWERRTTDEDFGIVRLGMGILPSTVLYQLEESDKFDDPQLRAALKLQEESQFVSEVPILISLRPRTNEKQAKQAEQEEGQAAKEEEDKRIPVTHALGVTGKAPVVHEFIRALLAHYVTFHAPIDARLYVLSSHKQGWGWTDTVPHCGADESNRYTCFLDVEQEGGGRWVFWPGGGRGSAYPLPRGVA